MQKGSIKPWQIGVFVAAVGAVVFGVYTLATANRSPVMDEWLYVDVHSGDLFSYHASKSPVVPAANPDTGDASLLPVEKVDGGYKLRRRFVGGLDLIPVSPDAVNPSTLEVKVSDKSVRRLTKLAAGRMKLDQQGPPDPQDVPNEVPEEPK